jgi:hypothetical protein
MDGILRGSHAGWNVVLNLDCVQLSAIGKEEEEDRGLQTTSISSVGISKE